MSVQNINPNTETFGTWVDRFNALNADVANLEGLSSLLVYNTYAAADLDKGDLFENQFLEVTNDESRGGYRTRYKVVASTLVFQEIIPQNTVLEFQTFALADADKAHFADGTIIMVVEDENNRKFTTIYRKEAGPVLTLIKTIASSTSTARMRYLFG